MSKATTTSDDTGQLTSPRGLHREAQQPVTQPERHAAQRLRTPFVPVPPAFTWLAFERPLPRRNARRQPERSMPTVNCSRPATSSVIPGTIRGLLANGYWSRSGIRLTCWGGAGVVASVSNQAASVCPAFPMIRSKYVRRLTPGRDAMVTINVSPGSARSIASVRRARRSGQIGTTRAERKWLLERSNRVVRAPTRVTTLRFLASL